MTQHAKLLQDGDTRREWSRQRGKHNPGILRTTCLLLLLAMLHPVSARAYWMHLGTLDEFDIDGPTLTLRCGADSVRIDAMSEHVVRVRLAPGGVFGREFSWAVDDLSPAGQLTKTAENDRHLKVSTGKLEIVVSREPCRIEIRDENGRVLVADDPQRGMAYADEHLPGTQARAVRTWHKLEDWTGIYGLGEKTGPLNKSGLSYTMWNTDAYGYGPAGDPIYKSIPFFLSGKEANFHGVFFDNPWRSSFDFGQSERNILTFGADGGQLTYYAIAGPHPRDVVQRFAKLTGRMELPPEWAMGYHQCRYSYYPESRVRELANTFRQKKIPCDVLYFDINYMHGYRCFTWEKKWFPDPRKLIDDLHGQGFRAVAIIDPAIKHEPGYFVYDEGTKVDAWLKRPDGETYVGRVWPGRAVFPDFTNPDVREWWSDLYPPFLAACGLDGIWNDMNEPADFDGPNKTVPLNLRHFNEGEPASHRACHNIYGMQMARATLAGIRKARPGVRPMVITRAAYAGAQRYGATWTGDNTSSWEHLRMSIPMVLNLGVSGIPFAGPDIGGFVKGATPELYARWIQVGSLFPFARTHTGWGNPDQEPWSFGEEVERIARRSIERRYELLPLLYTLIEEASRTGVPVMRPIWLEFPWSGGPDHTFMLGSDLLVVPVVGPGETSFLHWLPPGPWYEVNTGLLHHEGEPVRVRAPLDTLPMFVRGGAIIPMQSVVQSTAESPTESLILDAWPLGESAATLYEDDGETLAYQNGDFRRTGFRCVAKDNRVELTMSAPEGSYVPSARSPLVRLHALPRRIARVECAYAGGGQDVDVSRSSGSSRVPQAGDFYFSEDQGAWLVRMLPDDGREQRLTVHLVDAVPDDRRNIEIRFDDVERDVSHYNDFMQPRKTADGLALVVHSVWDPYLVLRRVAFPAEAFPVLRLSAMTERAQKLRVSFSGLDGLERVRRGSVEVDLTADGSYHHYEMDLSSSTEDWAGKIYYLRIDFEDGVQPAEQMGLGAVSFHPK